VYDWADTTKCRAIDSIYGADTVTGVTQRAIRRNANYGLYVTTVGVAEEENFDKL
jgi:hypothetical protein